jgi:hypothetical protein
MSSDGSDRSVRGYRAATDTLDERPSAATRATILAAAARQVQAGPRDAREPIAAPGVAPRKRWPYAAAAAVLLSSLAVMMATRTEREMPTFTAPVERIAENTAPSKPVPSSDSRAPASASTKAPKVASAPAAVPAQAQKPAQAETSRAGAAVAADEVKAAPPAEAPRMKEEVAVLRDTPAPAAAPPLSASADAAPVAMPAQLAKRQPAPASEATERRRKESADAASMERSNLQSAPAAPPAAGRGAATGAVRMDADAAKLSSASDWLERIIKLRRAGRHDEADVELKRFRESHPQVTVPAEALSATGTR